MSDERREAIPQDELVPEDDAIIGRVFRWSLLVVGAAALVVVAGVSLTRRDVAADTVREKELGAVPDLAPEVERMPVVAFDDVTAEAGIDFTHESGARGEKLLPETMGSGVAFFDPDGDGDQDVVLLNGTPWPGAPAPPRPASPRFYRNDGTGRFTDASGEVGLDRPLYGMGVAVGDYDGDGDRDLYLTALGPNRLYRNDAGRFRDVTAGAGVAGGPVDWSTSAGFFDYDDDGDLDLFVCNYVRWSREIDLELNFTLNGRDRAYGPPTNYEGAHSRLYRNDGDGTFRDVSAEAGIEVVNPLGGRPMGKALAVSFADADRDGWIDVLVANDTVQNFLFHNRGDGTFEEIGAVSGVGFDSGGTATGAMGLDVAHYRDDEALAVGIANFANEMTSLYVSQGALQFTDEAAGEGIGAPSRRFLSFGLFFFDFDLDGRLDMLQANGHLENEISQVQASQTYEQPAQLFWNQGPEAGSCYAEVPLDRLGDLGRPIVGRGAAYADIDGDADLDLLLTQAGGRPLLLRNGLDNGNRAVRLVLEGTRSNRDAIGAWVELTAGGRTQRRQVMPTRSYLSQVELALTFGLGRQATVERVRVEWPDGSVEELDTLPEPGTTLRVRQAEPA